MMKKRKQWMILISVLMVMTILSACASPTLSSSNPSGGASSELPVSSMPVQASSVPAAPSSDAPASSAESSSVPAASQLHVPEVDQLPFILGFESMQDMHDRFETTARDNTMARYVHSLTKDYNTGNVYFITGTDNCLYQSLEEPEVIHQVLPCDRIVLLNHLVGADGCAFVTSRGEAYVYSSESKEATRLCELPVEVEDVARIGFLMDENRIYIRERTEETYGLYETADMDALHADLEGTEIETNAILNGGDEYIKWLNEVFYSYRDIYYDFTTGECIPLTKSEVLNMYAEGLPIEEEFFDFEIE